MSEKRAAGFAAEDVAAAHLQKRGCRILKRNYHSRRGEVDIIVDDNGETVFVEVRKRASLDDAAESITPAKQKKLIAAANHYLSSDGLAGACRFDAVLVDGDGKVEWVKNAFAP